MKLPALTKTYGGRTVLDLPGLTLEERQIHAVIGANGSGKSTLARILAGALPPDGGRPPLDPRAVRVGYMPQKSYPFQMTVLRNVLLGGGDRDRARALLDRLGIGALVDQSARKLSGGETARMALARLLMGRYGLLLLDEPTAAMDVNATLLAEEALRDYQAETGCTILLVTHSLKQARRLAHRVLFLREGRLVEQGEAAQVLTNPREPATRAFLEFYSL